MPNLNGSLVANGTASEDAHWIVHKVSEGRIRMFESVAQPGCFLRLKDGACDIMVSALHQRMLIGLFARCLREEYRCLRVWLSLDAF